MKTLGNKKHPGARSYKGMSEPKQFAGHLEGLSKKLYNKDKKRGIKRLVDPKDSKIPGASVFLKK